MSSLTAAFHFSLLTFHLQRLCDFDACLFEEQSCIRIDHALLSPQAADKLLACVIHRDVRGWDKPSDHVPVVTELDL